MHFGHGSGVWVLWTRNWCCCQSTLCHNNLQPRSERPCCVYLFISRSCSQHLQVANWVTAFWVGQYAYVKYLWARANSFHCFSALCPLHCFLCKEHSEMEWRRGYAKSRNMHIISSTFPKLTTHICTSKTWRQFAYSQENLAVLVKAYFIMRSLERISKSKSIHLYYYPKYKTG